MREPGGQPVEEDAIYDDKNTEEGDLNHTSQALVCASLNNQSREGERKDHFSHTKASDLYHSSFTTTAYDRQRCPHRRKLPSVLLQLQLHPSQEGEH